MYQLRGVVQHYDWGHPHFIPSFLGVPDDGQPWAELWFGTHPNGPSDALVDTTWAPLRSVVGDIDILVKILAAERPLSLQTHPSRAHATAGFARENTLGVPIDAPTRVYKDENDKPEMLVALTDFSALCGFAPRPVAVSRLRDMGWTSEAERLERDGTRGYLEWAYSVTAQVDVSRAPSWLADIARLYPHDRSLRVAPLLNVVHLAQGEALALPAGNLHAYLRGCALEVMSSSDNVIRAGFTSKHVDVDELLSVIDTSELLEPKVRTVTTAHGTRYDSSLDAFTVELVRVRGDHVLSAVSSNRIIVCTEGKVGALQRGEAVFVGRDEPLTLSGNGDVFVCSGR